MMPALSFTAPAPEAIPEVLARLGIRPGGVLFIHSAFRALGRAGYDPHGVATDLARYMRDGTLLMPAMSWRLVTPDSPTFSETDTPAITGVLSETFRRTIATARSLHPTHSVSGIGRAARALLEEHHLDDTPCSRRSPFGRLVESDAQILLIGVDMRRCTLCHVFEEEAAPDLYLHPPEAAESYTCVDRRGARYHVRLRRHLRVPRCFVQFERGLGEAGELRRFDVAETPFVAFEARDLATRMRETLARRPDAILSPDPPAEMHW